MAAIAEAAVAVASVVTTTKRRLTVDCRLPVTGWCFCVLANCEVAKLKTSVKSMPCVAVGGGSALPRGVLHSSSAELATLKRKICTIFVF